MLTFRQAAVLRAVASYGLKLGLMQGDPAIESQACAALRALNDQHGMPSRDNEGWDFRPPIPAPAGETKVQFVEAKIMGGGF